MSERRCPECGLTDVYKGGITASTKGATVRMHCMECGEAWSE